MACLAHGAHTSVGDGDTCSVIRQEASQDSGHTPSIIFGTFLKTMSELIGYATYVE